MEAIFELIKERIAACAKNGSMFTLPSEVEQYITNHEDVEPTFHFDWRYLALRKR